MEIFSSRVAGYCLKAAGNGVDQDSVESFEQWIAEIAVDHQIAKFWFGHQFLGDGYFGDLFNLLPMASDRCGVAQLIDDSSEVNV